MIETAIDTLLRVPAITSVVGVNLALEQLPEGSGYPALVYQTVSATPLQRLCTPSDGARVRVQLNPLAATVAAVGALHALARAALETDTPALIGSVRLVSCRLVGLGPWSKDPFTGMWTRPADYLLTHE